MRRDEATLARARRQPLWMFVRMRYEYLKDFARDLDYSPEYVSRVKTGVYVITPEFRRRCSTLFGRSESELFTDIAEGEALREGEEVAGG